MNQKEAKEFLPLITALAEGKIIQILSSGSWVDIWCPNFDFTVESYRVKPEMEYRPFTYDEFYSLFCKKRLVVKCIGFPGLHVINSFNDAGPIISGANTTFKYFFLDYEIVSEDGKLTPAGVLDEKS